MERARRRSHARPRVRRLGSAAGAVGTCNVAASASKLRPRAWADGEPGEQRWRVLYDGDCGLCMWLLCGLLGRDRRRRLHPLALQRLESEELLADLTPQERMASWHLISPEGARQSAGAALAPLLQQLPGGRLPAATLVRLPALADRSYRWVADHRSQLSKLVSTRAKQSAHECVRRRELEP